MIKCLNIGCGLGGCKFARELAKKTSANGNGANSIFMNISTDELEVIGRSISAGERIPIGNVDGGAGKDRSLSIDIFTEHFDFRKFLDNVKKRVIKEDIDLITIAFSVGGGTGSGIGPMLVSMLYTSIEAAITDKEVRVMGIALMPSFNEGIGVFRNTLLAINDMSKTIKGGGRFIAIENNSKESGGSHVERRDYLNENAATLIAEYVNGTNNYSQMGVLDMNDRRSGLAFSGMHSFARLKDCTIVRSPFIEPGSAHCKNLLAEVPEENADMYEAQLNSSGSHLDFKFGYTLNDEGVVAYHGFMNLPSATIAYRKRFDELKSLDMEGDVTTGSNSLDGLRSEVFNYSVRKNSSNIVVEDTDTSTKKSIDPIADAIAQFKDFGI